MAWKQELAKLKQDLKADPEPVAPPKPKPAPKPLDPSRSIEEEDAMFLAAMGRRVPPPPRTAVPSTAPTPPPPPPPPEEMDFQSAMQDLKGMKSVGKPSVPVAAEPAPAKVLSAAPPSPTPPPPAPLPEPPPVVLASPAPVPPAPCGPRLIHLAAGMAVEVDGTLDLRAHSVADARDRLLERIQDGRFLGWRTLHVHLGPEPELREMLLSCLQGAAPQLLQYAQAPIPMGGSQAWILYFHLA